MSNQFFVKIKIILSGAECEGWNVDGGVEKAEEGERAHRRYSLSYSIPIDELKFYFT